MGIVSFSFSFSTLPTWANHSAAQQSRDLGRSGDAGRAVVGWLDSCPGECSLSCSISGVWKLKVCCFKQISYFKSPIIFKYFPYKVRTQISFVFILSPPSLQSNKYNQHVHTPPPFKSRAHIQTSPFSYFMKTKIHQNPKPKLVPFPSLPFVTLNIYHILEFRVTTGVRSSLVCDTCCCSSPMLQYCSYLWHSGITICLSAEYFYIGCKKLQIWASE